MANCRNRGVVAVEWHNERHERGGVANCRMRGWKRRNGKLGGELDSTFVYDKGLPVVGLKNL